MSDKPIPDAADTLYAKAQSNIANFSFNQQVVDVFDDMINRSVPGYSFILDNIGKIAQVLCPSNAIVYDLGCSLGGVSLSLAKHLQEKSPTIIGVDNSEAMIEKCLMNVSKYQYGRFVQIEKGDLLSLDMQRCDMAVANFTMQFIAPEQRERVIANICDSLNDGGAFVVSEKIRVDDELLDSCLVDLHHRFKRENGYSDLEISQKRSALEKVMLLDNLDTHIHRLKSAGFSSVHTWFQQFNFVSLIALK